VYGDGSKISSRVHCGREDGVMGSLEARGIAEGDRTSFWQAVIVDLFPGGTALGHSSCAAAPLKTGIDAVGPRGDLQRHHGTSIGAGEQRLRTSTPSGLAQTAVDLQLCLARCKRGGI
jgi:hypothetical protein